MSGQDPVAVTLQAALQRGYLSPAQIQQAQAQAARAGAPGLLQLLHQRFLTPAQAADLGRVYQRALQGPSAAPLSDADAEQTLVTALTPDMIAPPPGQADSALTALPPGSGPGGAGFAAGPADDSRTIQPAAPAPTRADASRVGSPAASGGAGSTVGALVALAQSREGGPRREGFLGPYRLIRELARGGMGVVYEAEREGLDRRVALKQLLAGGQATAEEVERFLVEARIAARLRHPHIVGIHDVGQEGGNPYFAMDFIEGEDLDSRLRREGPLPGREAADLARKLAEALAYAHARAVLHRDIKPANVLLHEGQPILTDFGLAKDVQQEGQSGLTQAGAVMGTPSYMPPEQAEGHNELVDRRADVYSLGATLYAMLTGEPPFKGATVLNTITQVLSHEPVPPRKRQPGVERDLEVICLKCLEKEPAARYPTAQALAEDLGRFLAHQPIEARSPSAFERGSKWVRRNKAIASVLALCSLLLLAGGVAAVVWQRRSAAAAKAAELARARLAAQERLAAAEAKLEERYAVAFPLALDALQETSRYHSLRGEDPEARHAYFRAVLLLGRLALREGQWSVAEQTFQRAAKLEPGETIASAQRELARARSAEQRRRAAETEAAIASISSGQPQGSAIQEVEFTLLRLGGADTVERLLDRLDDYVEGALAAELDLLRGNRREPETEEVLRRFAELVEEGRRPIQSTMGDHWDRLLLLRNEATERQREATQTERMHEIDYQRALESWRVRQLGGGALRVALVCQRSLGRLPAARDNLRTVRSLARCLACEVSSDRVLPALQALCRLNDERALGPLYEHLARFPGKAVASRIKFELARTGRSLDQSLAGDTLARRLSRARTLARTQQGGLARPLLDEILREQPQNSEARLIRAQLAALSGKPTQARADLRVAIEAGADEASQLAQVGSIYLSLGDLADAKRYYDQALERSEDPLERARLLQNLGVMQMGLNQLQRAEAYFERSLRARVTTDCLVYYGRFMLELGKLERAKELYARARERSPRGVSWVAGVVNCLALEQRFEEARGILDEAIERAPDEWSLYRDRSGLLLRSREPSAALEDVALGLSTAKDPRARAELLNNKAHALFELGRSAEAIRILEQVRREVPALALTHLNLCKLYWAQGQAEQAELAGQRALQLSPRQCVDAHAILGQIALMRGELEAAGQHATSGLRLRPNNPQLLNLVGMIQLLSGRLVEARAALERALRFAPRSPEVLQNLGKLALTEGKLEEAEGHFKAGCSVDVKNPQLWLARGLVALQLERWKEGERFLRRALELAPSLLEAKRLLGDAARLQGRWPEAARHYEAVLELEPQNPRACLGMAAALHQTKGASREVEELLVRFTSRAPADPDLPAAKKLLAEVRAELAEQKQD